MNKRIKKFMRLGVAAAFAVALGMVPAITSANGASLDLNPRLDPEHKTSLTIHKFVKDGFGEPNATGKEILGESGLGEPIGNVKFKLQKIKLTKPISTPEGQAEATALTPETAKSKIDPDFPEETLTTAAAGPDLGIVSRPDLDQGVYLVTEIPDPTLKTKDDKTLVPAAPFLVMLPMTDSETQGQWIYDVHVYPKNQKTGSVKKVTDAGKHSGDDISFDIAADVPPLANKESFKKLVIKDTLDKDKLTAQDVAGVTKVIVKGGTETPLTTPTDYTVQYTAATQAYEISLTAKGLEKVYETTEGKSGFQVIATIVATVKPIATGGDGIIKNKATVVTNSGNGEVTTETNETQTKYGQLKVFKYAEGEKGEQPLKDATFELYYCNDQGKPDGEKITLENNVSSWTTDEHGYLTINALHVTDFENNAAVKPDEQKKYCLVEKVAPPNYELAPAAIPFTFTSTELQNSPELGLTVTKSIKVKNNPSTTPWLPLTGGPGIILLVIAGVAIIAGGTIYGLRSRKLNK